MDEEYDTETLRGALASALVVSSVHLDEGGEGALTCVQDNGAGGEAGYHCLRVPSDLGGAYEVRGLDGPPRTVVRLLSLARKQGARWLVVDEDGGAVIHGVQTYPAGEGGE